MAWKRHLFAFMTICCLVLPLMSVPALPQNGTRQGTGPVHNIDKGTYYSTIQAGIDDADSGNTLEVATGTYNENLVIDKTMTLIGENKTTTIIDGNNTGDVVLITSDWVNLTGFTIRNSGKYWFGSGDSGLKIHGAQNCSISNNTITQNEIAVSIWSSFGSGDSSIIELWHKGGDYPQINNLGQVVWEGLNDTDYRSAKHIMFWDGDATTQLTEDYYVDLGDPIINDNGEIVWWGSKYTYTEFIGDMENIWGDEGEIYLWDGNEEIMITNNDEEEEGLDINDLGQVIWANRSGIQLWNGENITQIDESSTETGWLRINNNGQVMWAADIGGHQNQLFFWDGSNVTQITNYTWGISRPEINNNGHVVFEKSDGDGKEICYWDSNTVTQLTNNSHHDLFPQINDKGQVTWIGGGHEGNIMFWDGNDTIQITNTNSDKRPKINNQGHVTWHGYFSNEIYFWDGTDTTILTVGDLSGRDPQINENDYVVWDGGITSGSGVSMWTGGNITANYANNNAIFNNTISYNEHGVRIETAYDNHIYHNYFVNNSNQTFCRQPNYWDDGYPSGGNFWSDYNGTDTRSGPHQNITGSDGIGDTVYAIFGGSYVDNYPLMAMEPSSVTFPPDATPEGADFPWFPIIFGSAIGVGIGLGLATEIIKYSLLLLFLPLYMKIRKEEVLDLYLRGKIHGYIVANPGEHYNGIKKALNINNGSLAYHLSVLEKEELVKSRNEGVYKCFYPYTMNLNGGEAPVTNAQKLILIQIEKNPGITQKLVASRLGLHPSTVNYHIKNLQKNNLVRTEKKGFSVKYFKK